MFFSITGRHTCSRLTFKNWQRWPIANLRFYTTQKLETIISKIGHRWTEFISFRLLRMFHDVESTAAAFCNTVHSVNSHQSLGTSSHSWLSGSIHSHNSSAQSCSIHPFSPSSPPSIKIYFKPSPMRVKLASTTLKSRILIILQNSGTHRIGCQRLRLYG